jgi:hypothetical protein
MIRVT